MLDPDIESSASSASTCLSSSDRLDERRIAGLLGQKTLSMARHYSRSANLAAKNRETMATLESENARRARIVKPSAKSVKPEPKDKSE